MKKIILFSALCATVLMTISGETVENQSISPAQAIAKPDTAKAIKVRYKNWRGEVANRTIIPQELYWGTTEYHPQEQWLLKVWDVDRNAERVYALQEIEEFLK